MRAANHGHERRLGGKLHMKTSLRALAGGLALLATTAGSANAQGPAPSVLIENVRIFDGRGDRLSAPSSVLIVGNTIKAISAAPIAPPADAPVTRIAGGGRTLMPGLIDAHVHMMFATVSLVAALTTDIGFVNVAAVKGAGDMLHARLHQRARPRRTGVRPQARHRRRAGAGAAHLALRRLHLPDRRPRRLPVAQRRCRRGRTTSTTRSA